jgi:hypothetical protein
VPHKALMAVVRGEMGMGGESFGDLRLDGMSQKLASAVAQDFGERISEFTRLAQGDNCRVFHDGVDGLSSMASDVPKRGRQSDNKGDKP